MFMFCTNNVWRPHLKSFLETWVPSRRRPRKYWSRYGAGRRSVYYRFGGKVLALPEHGTTPWGDKCNYLGTHDYFDPGNWHYTISMVLLFGDLSRGNGSVGGNVEIALGLRCVIQEGNASCGNFTFASTTVSELWCATAHRWFVCTSWRATGIDAVRAELCM